MSIRLRTKILISFTAILILLSSLGIIALYNRNLLFQNLSKHEDTIYRLKTFSSIQLAIDMSVMPPNDYLITGDMGEKDKFLKLAADVEKGFKELEGMSLSEEYRKLMEKAEEKFVLLKDKAEDIFSIKDPVGNRRGAELMQEIDALARDIILNHLNKHYKLNEKAVRNEVSAAATAGKKVDALLLAGAVASLALTILLILYLLRSILRPLIEFRKGAFIIGSGNLDHKIDLRDGVEVNILVDEFNRMAGKLKKSYESLEQKVEERTRDLNEANRMLKELSITDGLTGAFNHRYFYERLGDELGRAGRYKRDLSLIMADIDHFKRYNDDNGHMAGDEVLKGISSCIHRGLREQDILARYGGEEFSIILPETGKAEAKALAERIRQCVSEQPFPHKDTQPGGNLTISLGVASFPEDAEDLKGLIGKADKALYSAKEKGRNRVESA